MRRSWSTILLVVGLLGLLVVLGALQYRWLSQISDSDGEKAHRRLQEQTDHFAMDFNREIQNAYFNFQADAETWKAKEPKKNGYDVARDLRQKGIDTPILMLTAKGETIDKVLGLKLGADDYLTKPFEVIELLARVEALLRRSPTQTNGTTAQAFRFGSVTIDFKRAEVTKDNAAIDLSAMEFKLLQYLIENRGLVHSRDHLLDAVWGYDAMPTTRTVDVHVAWLRQKLEENPRHPQFIHTVHGLGYKFTT